MTFLHQRHRRKLQYLPMTLVKERPSEDLFVVL